MAEFATKCFAYGDALGAVIANFLSVVFWGACAEGLLQKKKAMSEAEIRRRILREFFPERIHDRRKWLDSFQGPRDKTVVHIPARGGSVRVPHKNICKIHGLPLIAYTIRIAKAMGVDRVIVNTDDYAIKEVAESYGAEVPFIRPEFLSDENISPGFAGFYAQCHLLAEDYPLDIFVEMYPTSLFRNVCMMQKYLAEVSAVGHCFTCAAVDIPGYSYYDHEGVLEPLHGFQQKDKHLKPIANFIGLKMDWFDRVALSYQAVTSPIELVDIDTHADVELAEYIIANNVYDFGMAL